MEVRGRPSRTLGMVGGLIVAFAAIVHAVDNTTLGSAIAVPISPDGVQRATVILDSYSYSPNHLVVENGKPVELTLTSVTIITPHNFIIKDLGGNLSVEEDVSAGKTVMVRFVPPEVGVFPFYCDKRLWPMPSHRDKGMEGLLEVK